MTECHCTIHDEEFEVFPSIFTRLNVILQSAVLLL